MRDGGGSGLTPISGAAAQIYDSFSPMLNAWDDGGAYIDPVLVLSLSFPLPPPLPTLSRTLPKLLFRQA